MQWIIIKSGCTVHNSVSDTFFHNQSSKIVKTKIVCQLLPLALLMVVLGCSKKDDASSVSPDVATSVTGTYIINGIIYSGQPYPITPDKANTIKISRTNTETVSMEVKTGTTGAAFSDIALSETTGAVSFRKTYADGSSVSGNIAKDTLTFYNIRSDAGVVGYRASK